MVYPRFGERKVGRRNGAFATASDGCRPEPEAPVRVAECGKRPAQVVFIVNSLSSPSTNWDQFEDGPGAIDTLLKASGVPIDKFSYEAVEQLKDIEARWKVMQFIDQTATFSKADDPTVRYIKAAPKARIYPIDVSFHGLRDEKERAYLNQLPTSFVLSDEQVDRLRRAAAQIIADSPEFQRALKESGVRVVHGPLETPAR